MGKMKIKTSPSRKAFLVFDSLREYETFSVK